MNSNLYNNQNIGDNKSLISHPEKNENNNNNKNLNSNMENANTKKKEENFVFSSNFKNLDPQYIQKKRKNPLEEKKEENVLNEIEIYDVLKKNVLLMEHEIEKKEKRKMKLKEDIQKIQKELDELNVEIEKYENIKNSNLQIINTMNNNENNHEGKDEIKNIMNNNKEEKKGDLFLFNQSLNLKSKQFVNNSNNFFKELNDPTIVQTEIIQTENKNSGNKYSNVNPLCINTSMVFKIKGKHKFLNNETINNNIEENKNTRNILKRFDQYSFRCLTHNLNFKIKEGTKEASIKIELENNGKFCWPKDETFLKTDELKSTIESQKIRLCPLNPKEKQSVNIQFNLDKLKPGIYIDCLAFNVKGKNIGNNITINIEIY